MWPGPSPSAVVNGAAGMVIAALLIAALYFGRDLLIPLALAGLLGFVLAPLVRRLEQLGLPNAVSVAVVMAVLLTGLFADFTVAGLSKRYRLTKPICETRPDTCTSNWEGPGYGNGPPPRSTASKRRYAIRNRKSR